VGAGKSARDQDAIEIESAEKGTCTFSKNEQEDSKRTSYNFLAGLGWQDFVVLGAALVWLVITCCLIRGFKVVYFRHKGLYITMNG
jgi:hypothetical protein